MFEGIQFADKNLLWLLGIIPLLTAWYIWSFRRQRVEVKLPTLGAFKSAGHSLRPALRHSLFLFRMLGVALIIIALARPQTSSKEEKVTTEGIDIVMAMDISSSMLAEDLKPNRIKASKQLAIEFVKGRPGDRIGMVVFAGESFTQCPLTIDHAVLTRLMEEVITDNNGELIIEDGTAIGMGLATAVNRLKGSDAVSKVVILLTDGVNNAGFIPPLDAATLAKKFGMRVYTIGVGSYGMAPYPVRTPYGVTYQQMKVEIDEELMQKISAMTDGRYFRATDNKRLEEVYREIDLLEKTRIEVSAIQRHSEEYLLFALLAGAALFLEILLRHTIFKSVL